MRPLQISCGAFVMHYKQVMVKFMPTLKPACQFTEERAHSTYRQRVRDGHKLCAKCILIASLGRSEVRKCLVYETAKRNCERNDCEATENKLLQGEPEFSTFSSKSKMEEEKKIYMFNVRHWEIKEHLLPIHPLAGSSLGLLGDHHI